MSSSLPVHAEPDPDYKPLDMMTLQMTLNFIELSAVSRYVHDPSNIGAILSKLNDVVMQLELVVPSDPHQTCPRMTNHSISCGCIPQVVGNALERWRVRRNEEDS